MQWRWPPVLGTSQWLVIRVITLVAAVAGMAYVLNLPSTQKLQKRLGITQLAVAGLPLILLGMLTRAPQLGVLSDALLDQLSPLIGIALAGLFGLAAGIDAWSSRATWIVLGFISVVLAALLWRPLGAEAGQVARAGEEVALKSRPVRVDAVRVTGYEWPWLDVEIDCGKGTYVRSISRDLGIALGVGGMVQTLRRTRVGSFTAGQGVGVDAPPADLAARLLPMALALGETPCVTLGADELRRFRMGQRVRYAPASRGRQPPDSRRARRRVRGLTPPARRLPGAAGGSSSPCRWASTAPSPPTSCGGSW